MPALTLYTTPDVSRALWDQPDADALAALVTEAAVHLNGAEVVAGELKRWRCARPATTLDGGCLTLAGNIVIAGDAFHHAKVEGAWLSGRDAAATLGLT